MSQEPAALDLFGRDLTGRRLPGLRLVRHRWWWLLVGAAIGLAAGMGIGFLQPPTYASTAILTVSSPDPVDVPSLSRGAQALARLATEPAVVGTPLRTAGLAEAAGDPRLFVRVVAAPDAPIISVTGTAADAATAQKIAHTVSTALTDLRPFPPFEATVVAAATEPTKTTTPSWALPAGATGVGAALALVLAVTVPFRRRRKPAGAAREADDARLESVV